MTDCTPASHKDHMWPIGADEPPSHAVRELLERRLDLEAGLREVFARAERSRPSRPCQPPSSQQEGCARPRGVGGCKTRVRHTVGHCSPGARHPYGECVAELREP
ncbi:hypothetical protein Ntsu_79210 [Nocardia sp. IFM 10818]